ncbi:ABC transporter substrate-binding protein [Herbiconiux sp. KACC 21604]|uniref:ABC transporter substrate-binding protein n=1 Tax=unclassified Herbiconiux TaxID=2618217 RepID=UPI001490DF0C|nr:ABC transporter substrate-binding protein [Herbiconiux sp. SALV-R1]QJU55128.1 ABC transporter substrate-binding protein [Herbiconiux sp. SALV-R1]WPO86278.1 ABC transporter substrate-binding protein [Herbiconiux sp. KACC 21604]
MNTAPLLRPRRVTATLVAAMATAALLAGCSTPGSEDGTPTAGAESGSGAESFGLSPVDSVTALVPDDLAGKALTVAIYNDGAPQQFLEDGKLVGIQPDFAQAVAEVSGLDFQASGVGSFDSIIPGLQGGRYDAAFVDFGVTEERQEIVDLVFQFVLPTGFAVREGAELTLDTQSDLCGIKLATLAGSYFIDQVEAISEECVAGGEPAIDIQTFPTQTDAVLAVSTGRSDAYAVSSDQLAYAADQENAKLAVQAFEHEPLPQAIGVPKDSALGPVVVEALKVLIADGTYQKILDKWGISTAAITADQVVINPL